jgi:hypothetical protein
VFFYLQIVVSIFLLFLLFFVRGSLENPIYSILKFRHSKFDKIISRLRFYIPWLLFNEMNNNYMDIKIISSSNKSSHVWYLRKDKCIGNYYFNNDLSSLTLTFYYKEMFSSFLNKFCLNKVQEFYFNKNEVCKSLIIEKHWFDSFDEKSINYRLNPINIGQLFNWKND